MMNRMLLALLLALSLSLPAWAASDGQIDTADIRDDAITDAEVDWGTGTGEVNAADVPVIDTAAHFTVDTVEAALAELATLAGAVYWQRIGTLLRPLHAGDDLYLGNNEQAILESDTSSEQKLAIGDPDDSYYRFAVLADGTVQFGGGAAATDATIARTGVAEITANGKVKAIMFDAGNASSGGTAVAGDATGEIGYGGKFTASGDSFAIGVSGNASGAGMSYGLYGGLSGDAEASDENYSVYSEERIYLGDWADLSEQASPPDTPASGTGHLYCSTDGKLYWLNDADTAFDLTASGGAGQIVLQAQELGAGASGDTHWEKDEHGAVVAVDTSYDFNFGTNKQASGQVDFHWVVARPAETAQYAGLALGGEMPYRADTVTLSAMMQLEQSAALPEDEQVFDSVKFYLNSSDGAYGALSSDQATTIEAGGWVVVSAEFDISTWKSLTGEDDCLFYGMVFDPNDLSGIEEPVGNTDVTVSFTWLAAEQE